MSELSCFGDPSAVPPARPRLRQVVLRGENRSWAVVKGAAGWRVTGPYGFSVPSPRDATWEEARDLALAWATADASLGLFDRFRAEREGRPGRKRRRMAAAKARAILYCWCGEAGCSRLSTTRP